MVDLIREYQQQRDQLRELIDHYRNVLKEETRRRRNIEAARVARKIRVMKEELEDLEYGIRKMKQYEEKK